MHSKVSSDWLPRYIKATRPVLEIFKMAGYFPDSLRTYIYTYTHIVTVHIITVHHQYISQSVRHFATATVSYLMYRCLVQ